MNTYTWNCATVDAYPTHSDDNGIQQSNVVYNVHWRLTGSDGTNETTIIGTEMIDVSDLSSFTDFSEVSHADVIAWTEAAMGEERVSELKSSLDAMLAEMATPSTVTLTIEE